jgi:hypothetical protein
VLTSPLKTEVRNIGSIFWWFGPLFVRPSYCSVEQQRNRYYEGAHTLFGTNSTVASLQTQ